MRSLTDSIRCWLSPSNHNSSFHQNTILSSISLINSNPIFSAADYLNNNHSNIVLCSYNYILSNNYQAHHKSQKNNQQKKSGSINYRILSLQNQTEINGLVFFVIQIPLNFWPTQQSIDLHCIVERRIRLEMDFRSDTQTKCVR